MPDAEGTTRTALAATGQTIAGRGVVRVSEEGVRSQEPEVRIPNLTERGPGPQRRCELRDLGHMGYPEALELQHALAERRKRGEIPDQLLIVEHPPVVTMGRNGHDENLLAAPDLLARAGIAFHRTDRGGDATFHGPGQVVGYPIFDLREWKRDVVAYVRGLEEALIRALAEFGIQGERVPGATGVWAATPAGLAKVAAIGVHISRWVTSHGFALNVDTDLNFFRYIVPCGLTRPVTSMRALGSTATRAEAVAAVARGFARVFDRMIVETSLAASFTENL